MYVQMKFGFLFDLKLRQLLCLCMSIECECVYECRYRQTSSVDISMYVIHNAVVVGRANEIT